MSSLDYLLAVTLLTAPVEAETNLRPPDFRTIAPAVQKLAVRWELLDPRETRYVLARPEDFTADLKMLRRRRQELDRAPNLADGNRFPDRATVTDFLTFNRTYRQCMDVRQAVEPVHHGEFRAAVEEADRLYHIWDLVRDARCDYYYVTVRRQALLNLREAIGEDAYYAARLPPHVPVWRCQRID